MYYHRGYHLPLKLSYTMINRKISLILPVLNESLVFRDIKKIEEEFTRLNQNFEIICVFDSSAEKSSSKLKISRLSHVTTLFYPLARFGAGFARCYGFNQSKGSLIFFWEGNFSISPEELLLYLNLMETTRADIIIGSKRHPLSQVYYSSFRHFASKLYHLLVRIIFGLKVTDTQVGLKLYKRRVLNEVIPRIIIKNWGFDLEILVVANALGFKRIVEAPIKIKRHFTGKGLTPSNISNLLQDTLAIAYRKYWLKYYQ